MKLPVFKNQLRTATLRTFYLTRRTLPNFTHYCIQTINKHVRLSNALRVFLDRETIKFSHGEKEISLYQSLKWDIQRAVQTITVLLTQKHSIRQLGQGIKRDVIPNIIPLSSRAFHIYTKLLSELKKKHNREKFRL